MADELARRIGGRFRPGKFRTAAAEGRLAGTPVTVLKPLTYMNESGGPVAGLRGFYHLPPDRIVVIHDELDLPFGAIRLKFGGGDNGHNGLRSVTARAGHPGLLPGALRHQPAAGADGPGGLRAA